MTAEKYAGGRMHIDELSLDELLDLNEQICLRIDYLRARNDMLMLSCMFRLNPNTHFGPIRSPISV